jgi:HSP20 family protein
LRESPGPASRVQQAVPTTKTNRPAPSAAEIHHPSTHHPEITTMRITRYTYPNHRALATAPAGFVRSPWNGLEEEIDRLFTSALTDFSGAAAPATRFPLDLYEDENNTYVRAELPGVNRDDINVEVVDGELRLAATRKHTDGEREQSFAFSRSVTLPDTVQADQVSAAYENGVLTVTLPKREEAKPKKVAIAVK